MKVASALPIAALFLALSAGSTRADPPVVADELKSYYADGNKEPAWREAIKRLLPNDDKAADAAVYLRELLDQALKDELSGAAPWRATPYWGSSGENPAHELRKRIAGNLADSPASPAAVPVARWFLDSEKLSQLQETALKAVTKAEGKEADALLLDLASKPHPNAAVVVESLREVDRRKLPIKADTLFALCQHYRLSIRKAAVAAAKTAGLPEPPPVDSAKAVQSESIHRLMDGVGLLLLDPPAADAPFVKATSKHTEGHEWSEHGWIISEDEDTWVVLTIHGKQERYWKKEGRLWTTHLSEAPLQQWIDQVVAARTAGNKDFELSELGGLSGQFQGNGATLAEVLLAQRLYVAKQYDLAATVLFPALDTLLLDEHFLDLTRDQLGDPYGHQMLGAFANDRDYDAALKVAKHITENLDHTRFHAEAVRFLDELPRRRDDFKEFRLPTAAEWKAEKKRLTRSEQIDYLCRRLRLLNCYQHGQPGGISFLDRQYAEAETLGGQRTEVINPYVELLGNKGESHYSDEAISDGLGLTAADIRFLAEYLRDDWYMPSVSYWRDFHPQRHVERTRPLVADLINEAARSELCDERKLDAMTADELDREIEHLKRWGELGSVTGKLKAVLTVTLAFAVLVALVLVARRATRSFRSASAQRRTARPE